MPQQLAKTLTIPPEPSAETLLPACMLCGSDRERFTRSDGACVCVDAMACCEQRNRGARVFVLQCSWCGSTAELWCADYSSTPNCIDARACEARRAAWLAANPTITETPW